MTLKDKIQSDITTALKAGEKTRVQVLRAVLGAVQSAEKAGKTAVEFDDTKVIEVIGKQVKQRKETAKIYTDAGATDRAEIELQEVEILSEYLPVQLTEAEIREIVTQVIGDLGDKVQFGAVMGKVTAQTKGKADGKVVASIVQSILNG